MKEENASKELVEKVKNLIANHEVGGDEEQNVLCDADCLAYFEEKAMRWAILAKHEGKEGEMIEKIKYYFSRFKSEKAKAIARPFYDNVINFLK